MSEGKNTLTLKPCPFCGGEAMIGEEAHPLRDGKVMFSAGCVSYDEAECMGFQSLTSFNTRREAAQAWNIRADDPATLRDRNAELEAALRHPLLNELLGLFEGCNDNKAWLTAKSWMETRDAALAEHNVPGEE